MEKRIFEELENHLLSDEKPSKYIKLVLHKLKDTKLNIIRELEKIEQNPVHHPEGNVLNHTLLVIDAAAIVRKFANNKKVFMWSALLHDIGKINTTKLRKGKIVAYEHDIIGAKTVKNILDKFDFLDKSFKEKVESMVKYHMHNLYISKNLPFGNVKELILNVDMHDMILLFFSDKLGRGEVSKKEIKKVINELEDLINILNLKYNINLNTIIIELKEIYPK